MIDKIKNVFHDKNKRLIFIILVIIIILFFIFGIYSVFINFNNIDVEDFEIEYERLNGKKDDNGKKYPVVNISSDNKFKYSSCDEIINIFKNNDDAVIYFGYSSCLYCRTAVQILYEVSEDTEIDKIYYLDVSKKDGEYNELLNMIDDKFVDGNDDDLQIYSPLVLFVVNGEVIDYRKGTISSQNDPYLELDKFQKARLSRIYRFGINDVLESINNKKKMNDDRGI